MLIKISPKFKNILTALFIIIILTGSSYANSFKDGIDAYKNNDFVLAERYFMDALRIKPNDFTIRYYLAISLIKNHKFDEAKKQYNFIIKNAPNTEAAEKASQGLIQLKKFYDRPSLNKTTVSLDSFQTALIVNNIILNNQIKGNFVLDTGATFTIISTALANKLGISTNGALRINIMTANGGIRVPLVRLDSLEVNGLIAKDIPVIVYDFIPETNKISGLLGLSFLQKFKVTIDRTHNKLTLEKS